MNYVFWMQIKAPSGSLTPDTEGELNNATVKAHFLKLEMLKTFLK